MKITSKMRRTAVSAGAAVAVLVAGGVAFAGGDDEHNHDRITASSGAPTPMLAGQSTGAACRVGFDTQSNTLIPPDDSVADNPPAGTVNLRKTCQGAVIGTFVSEISTSTASPGYVHLEMRATCTGTGGMANACTVGQQVFGSPGHAMLNNHASPSAETNSMTMVWTGLRKGLWRFDALPGGYGGALLGSRTFTVEAFNGG